MNDQMLGRPIEVLLVEDNSDDVYLTKLAFEDAKVITNLNVVADGEAAMDFLHRRGKYTDVSRPDLILLDLNLPRKDGREVLEEIKTDENLRRIPVVILTTSSADKDILKTYNLHANCYLVKPIDLEQLFSLVHSVEDFWFTIVKLPPA